MHLRLGAAFIAAFALGGSLTAVSPPAHAAGHTPTCLGLKATIVGTPGNDTLRGTSHRDVVVGLGGKDTILGLGAVDHLCGGAGRDVVDGGAGVDQLSGGSGVDRLDGGRTGSFRDFFWADAGDDTYVAHGPQIDQPGAATILFIDAPRGVRVDAARGIARGWGHDTIRFPLGASIVGSSHADTLLGTDHSDDLMGGGGADRIEGRAGPFDLLSSTGRAVLEGGPGSDRIGGSVARVIRGGSGDDQLRLGTKRKQPESAVVRGGVGNDQVGAFLPEKGTFDLDGGTGDDGFYLHVFPRAQDTPWRHVVVDLTAGTGRANSRPFTATDLESIFIHEPRGGDAATRYDLTGTDGPNKILIDHTSAAMTVLGLGGDDTLATGPGDDTLDGGVGTDFGEGNGGTNTCISIETAGPGC
jgi:Ca2+-binding RTX toxin-like protein